jgi:hypothetical protein
VLLRHPDLTGDNIFVVPGDPTTVTSLIDGLFVTLLHMTSRLHRRPCGARNAKSCGGARISGVACCVW